MEDKTMLVRSGVVQYGICEANVKVTIPIYCRHNMLFTQSIEKDEQILLSHLKFYYEGPEYMEQSGLINLLKEARKNEARDLYQNQVFLNPKTKKYYLEAIFTFNTVKDASTFARTLTCEFEVTVRVSVNIIPELMDIKSLYLDMQLEHIRKMLSMTEPSNKNAREYLSRLEAIFTAALDCLARRIYSERCFSVEGELYMVLGFKFKSIESANEFAQRVTGNE
jgi:hypothetical protein